MNAMTIIRGDASPSGRNAFVSPAAGDLLMLVDAELASSIAVRVDLNVEQRSAI